MINEKNKSEMMPSQSRENTSASWQKTDAEQIGYPCSCDKEKTLVVLNEQKKPSAFDIILAIIEILSLVVIYFTLIEMKTERIMQYEPNLVFTPSFYVIHATEGEADIESIYADMAVWSPEVENLNTIFDKSARDNGNLNARFPLYSRLTNIGDGNATNIVINISKKSVIAAIDELNEDIEKRNKGRTNPIKLMTYEDYKETQESCDIVTDSIELSDGSVSLNSINSSVIERPIPYVLANQENTCKLYMPPIYYTFICETIKRYEKDFDFYDSFEFPNIKINISYNDVHGKYYAFDYEICTQFSHYAADMIGEITIEKTR